VHFGIVRGRKPSSVSSARADAERGGEGQSTMRVTTTELRKATQLFALLWANSFFGAFFTRKIYKGPLKSTCVPFLNCHACPTATFSCPIGTWQHYMATHQFPFFVIGQLGLIGMLVGRMVCGWLCPFGFVQDALSSSTRQPLQVPRAWTYLRYLVLALLVIAIPWITTEHWFSKLCPVGTLVAALPWVLWNPTDPETGAKIIAPGSFGWLLAAKIAILVAILVVSRVVKRPFCRIFCPLGLFFSFFNKVSILRLEVSPGCDGCDACQKLCPVDIKVYEDPNSSDCIRCLDCTSCAHVTVGLRLPLGMPAASDRDEQGSPSP
jgi:ferredoxin-type protein NapH